MDVKLPLSDKQKILLESIIPGIESGEVAGDWYVVYTFGGLDITGLGSDRELNELWATVEEADFEVFIRYGLFMRLPQTQQSVLRFALHKGAILDAYKRGWKLPSEDVSQVTISGGDFRGSNINIQSTLTNVQQSIGATTPLSDDNKARLIQLIEELKEALANANLPEQEAEEAETLAHHAQVAVEQLNREKPNKTLLKSSVDEFEKGIKNVGRILPPIIAIGAQIATILRPFIG